MDGNDSDASQPALIPILTTEHFTLQSARSIVMAEIGSRATIYFTAVSSSVVALAFVTTLAAPEVIIRSFALVLLPVLIFMGFVTQKRLVMLSYTDLYYQQAINRIRHFYVDVAPPAARYLSLSVHDDLPGIAASAVYPVRWWMGLIAAANMVAVVHYVIVGLAGGLLAHWLARATPAVAVAVGLAVGVAAAAVNEVVEGRNWVHYRATLEARFPSPAPPPADE